jgi:flagellar protein FlbD
MVELTRFNGSHFYLNAELILSVEGTPDCVITLINDVKLLVKDRPEEVVKKIIGYQQIVHNPSFKMDPRGE